MFSSAIKFIKETRKEVSRITWPERRATVLTLIMVLIFVSISSGILFVIDLGFLYLVNFIINFGS